MRLSTAGTLRTARPKLIGRTMVFRGRIFRVERDRVRLPDGHVATLEIVRHRGSVVLVPQPSRKTVVLIRQFRHALGRWIWELPAGSLEPGEAPARAVRRECEEEIGLTPGRVVRLAAFYPTPGFCDEVMIFYRCERLTGVSRAVRHDPDEQIRPKLFSIREAQRLIARGRIVDMKTVVGLGLVQGKFRRRK